MELNKLSWKLTGGGALGHPRKGYGPDGPSWWFKEENLTHIGLARLDSLRHQLNRIVVEHIPGDVIEAGVWRGGCCIWMRAVLDSFGDSRTVVVADSFAGFPEPDVERYPGDVRVHKWRRANHAYTASLDEVKANFAKYQLVGPVEFVEGSFRDTLWKLKDRLWSLIRLDGDSYEATHVSLENLYPGLSRGGYVISDDYGDPYKTLQAKQAVDDYRMEHNCSPDLEWVDDRCVYWRKQ